MKATSAWQIGKYVNRLHPQVALTKKESERLLDTLKSSFRQHLHSPDTSDHPPGPAGSHTNSLSLTGQHIASVLTNPIIAPTGFAADRTSFESQPKKHPIDLLEESVANGCATPYIADRCLAIFMNSMRQLAPLERRKTVRRYEPGSKALQWLWASGMADSEVIQAYPKLASKVVSLLTYENKEESIWNWIRAAQSTSPQPPKDLRSPQGSLLHMFVNVQFRRKSDSALSAFKQAVSQAESGTISHDSLRPAALAILSWSTRESSVFKGPIQHELVRNFLDSAKLWEPFDAGPVAVDLLRLRLLAPRENLDAGLKLAASLQMHSIDAAQGNEGKRAIKFLLTLSDSLQDHGNPAQIQQFYALLEDTHCAQSDNQVRNLGRQLRSLPDILRKDLREVSNAWPVQDQFMPG